jgi:hypothetical protein
MRLNCLCPGHEYSYFHSVYILLGIISYLDMIQGIQKDVHKVFPNTPFYVRDLVS